MLRSRRAGECTGGRRVGSLLLRTRSGIAGLVDTTTTRHLFFTGKGGVGKTSTACGLAIGLAQAGHCCW
jgi:ATP-dependent Clp protease ATP-binding subunit ClpA